MEKHLFSDGSGPRAAALVNVFAPKPAHKWKSLVAEDEIGFCFLTMKLNNESVPPVFKCQGNGLTLSTQAEGLSLQPYEEYLNVVRLVPENFRDFNSKKEVDRDRLMTVLANVTHLLIRANYNSAKMALYRCVLRRRGNLC